MRVIEFGLDIIWADRSAYYMALQRMKMPTLFLVVQREIYLFRFNCVDMMIHLALGLATSDLMGVWIAHVL